MGNFNKPAENQFVIVKLQSETETFYDWRKDWVEKIEHEQLRLARFKDGKFYFGDLTMSDSVYLPYTSDVKWRALTNWEASFIFSVRRFDLYKRFDNGIREIGLDNADVDKWGNGLTLTPP